MKSFPAFMKCRKNRVDSSQQHTEDIEGYYFEGRDGSQVAFWECHADRASEAHTHDFDEYLICVSGEYTVYMNGAEHVLRNGDEIVVPKGVEHSGRCIAGTRTIYVFGGRRLHQ